MACCVSVVNTNDFTVAADCECNVVVGCRNEVSVFVNNVNLNVRKLCAVSSNNLIFCCKFYRSWGRGSCYCFNSNLFSVFVVSNSCKCAGLVVHSPLKPEVTVSCALIFIILIICCILIIEIWLNNFKCLLLANQCAVTFLCASCFLEIKFNGPCVCINSYRNLSVRTCYLCTFCFILPIPVRENMNHWIVLYRSPLALIEIIGVFCKTCCVNNTKVRALRRCCCALVPRSRLAYVVKACPYKFTGNEFSVLMINKAFVSCSAPRNTVVIIGGLLVFRVRTGVTFLNYIRMSVLSTAACS